MRIYHIVAEYQIQHYLRIIERFQIAELQEKYCSLTI